MKIDKEVIERLGVLSQISILESEEDAFIDRLSKMADAIAPITEVDCSDIATMCNPFDATQRLRADEVTEENHRDDYQKCTEHTEKGLYLVPQVIE